MRLRQAEDHTIVFDCRFDLAAPDTAERAYATAHVPGALYLHLDRDLAGSKTGANGRHPLPSRAALQQRMAALGVNDDTLVVGYDAQDGMYAARLWWLLRWLGHAQVQVLDGGLQAWQGAGFEVTSELPPSPDRVTGNFSDRPALVEAVDVAQLETLITTGSKARLIVDARAPDRFRGENETMDPVGGHIPGAINRPFKQNLDAQGRFKAPQTLRAEFEALLAGHPAAETIQQCGSGVTACHNLLALEVAGLPGAALYPGSWSEWSADAKRPVARGAAS
ncbi:MAG: sulfurtransferase [Janthinobacterium lividum]